MSLNSNEISHKGKIISIDQDITIVEIISEAACSSCHAKGLCGLGESKAKQIEVVTSGWGNYNVGDEVDVVLKATMGHKAVVLAYAIPLVVLVAVLLGLIGLGVAELYAGLGAIGAVAVYYLILRLLKDRICKEYVFKIKR